MASTGVSPIASSEVLALFPTPVCRVQLAEDSYVPLNQAVGDQVAALVPTQPPLQPGERFRTGGTLHRREQFMPLADFVRENAEGVLSYLMAIYESIEVTACWADVRGSGARISEEADKNAYLSALYFASLPEGETQVSFRDPRRQNAILSPPSDAAHQADNRVSVREGTLLIFPAWLERAVGRNSSSAPSLSLGFNLMFKNYTATMSKPLWEGNTFKRA